jgi:hypothetical protein
MLKLTDALLSKEIWIQQHVHQRGGAKWNRYSDRRLERCSSDFW